MRSFLVLILIFSFQGLLAQEIEEDEIQVDLDEEIESSIYEEFGGTDFSIFNKIKDLSENQKLRPPELEEEFLDEQDPWVPKKARVYLKRGQVLYSLDGEKAFRTGRNIYAWARQKSRTSRVSFILDKKGEIRFKLFTKDLNFIEQDLKIDRDNYENITYREPIAFGVKENKIRFENDFSYQLEGISGNYYAQIFNSGEDHQTDSNSFNIRSAYKTYFGLDFGLEMSYQSGFFEDDFQIMRWESLSLGPLLKYTLKKDPDYHIFYSFSFIKSLYHKFTSEPLSGEFSSYRLRSAIESRIKYQAFDLLLALGISNEWISLEQSNQNIVQDTDRKSNFGFFLSVGLGFDYIL